MRAAFKAAARAVMVPAPKPVRKKTARRGGDGRPYSTECIVDGYLSLCRDPLSDLQRWLDEDKKKPSLPRTARHERHDTAANTQRFLRDTLHELSGRVHSHDNQGRNGRDVPRGSRTGAPESRELQQVQAERNLTHAARQPDDFTAQLSSIHGYYASRIAAVRATMRPEQAAAIIRNLRNEKTLAVRNAKSRQRAERAARKPPARAPVRPAFKASQPYKRYG